MKDFKDCIKNSSDCAYLRVRVIPNSSRQEIYDVMSDDTVKIRLKSVPEKWKANNELEKFLSVKLWIEWRKVQIVWGHTERTKLVRIDF